MDVEERKCMNEQFCFLNVSATNNKERKCMSEQK